MRRNRLSRVMPALLTRMSIGARARGFRRLRQAPPRRRYRKDCRRRYRRGRQVRPPAFPALRPGARQNDSRALRMQRLGDGPADAAAGAVTSAVLPVRSNITASLTAFSQTLRFRPAYRAPGSASSLSMRLTMPVRTLLPPASTVVSTPSRAAPAMLSRQRTRPVPVRPAAGGWSPVRWFRQR